MDTSLNGKVLATTLLMTLFAISVLATVFQAPIKASPAAEIVAKRVTESINVDGMAYESFWQNISWVEFPLTSTGLGGGHVTSVKVKIAHHGEYLFVLAQWSDPTDSDDKLQGSEDRFAMMISIGTPEMVTPCMKPGTNGAILAGEADQWHWKAARTDGDGKNFTYVSRRGVTYGPMPHPYSFAMDEYINTTARWREGLSEYTEMNATKYPFEATLHLYDVQAKGTWIGTSEGGQWTLELARKFTTDDPNRIDHQFAIGQEFSFALAVYDGGEGEDEDIKSITGTWHTAELSSEMLSPPLRGPQGPPGEQGPAGPQGEQGQSGVTAPEWTNYVSVGALILALIAIVAGATVFRKS